MKLVPGQEIEVTKAWIQRFVIAMDLCPFARFPYAEDLISYRVSHCESFQDCIREQLEVIQELLTTSPEEVSNHFTIYSPEVAFEFLLDLEYSLQGVLEESGVEGAFQTVVFHPDFRYEGEDPLGHGNYTNRSPYPMLHILRADEVSAAIEHYGDVSGIPERNTEVLERLQITSIGSIFEEDFERRVEATLQK